MKIGIRTGLLQSEEIDLASCARGFGWLAAGGLSFLCLAWLAIVFIIIGLHALSPVSLRARFLRNAASAGFILAMGVTFAGFVALPPWAETATMVTLLILTVVCMPLLLWQMTLLVRDFALILGRGDVRRNVFIRQLIFAGFAATTLVIGWTLVSRHPDFEVMLIFFLVFTFMAYLWLLDLFMRGRAICLAALHGAEDDLVTRVDSRLFFNRWWGNG